MSSDSEYVLLVPKRYCHNGLFHLGNTFYRTYPVDFGGQSFYMLFVLNNIDKIAFQLITNKQHFITLRIDKMLYNKLYFL